MVSGARSSSGGSGHVAVSGTAGDSRPSGAAGESVCCGLPAENGSGMVTEGRYVRESKSEYSELALPNDTNMLGNLLGGKIMHLVDLAGAIAAMRHSRSAVVTASVEQMEFIHP